MDARVASRVPGGPYRLGPSAPRLDLRALDGGLARTTGVAAGPGSRRSEASPAPR